jgi:hypothetical protein
MKSIAIALLMLSHATAQPTPDVLASSEPTATHLGAEVKTKEGRELWLVQDLRSGDDATGARGAARASAALDRLDRDRIRYGVETPLQIEHVAVAQDATTVDVPSLGGHLVVWAHPQRGPRLGEYIHLTAPPRRVLVMGFVPPTSAGAPAAEELPWLHLDADARTRHLVSLQLWGNTPPAKPKPQAPTSPKSPKPKETPKPKVQTPERSPGAGGGNKCPIRVLPAAIAKPVKKVGKPVKKLGKSAKKAVRGLGRAIRF